MINGLSEYEVNERIKQGKQNKPSITKTKKVAEIFIENIFSVFNLITFFITVFLIVFYFVEGDNRLLLDSIGVPLVAITNTLIAIIEEWRAKKALDEINFLLKREVSVIRDGREQVIEQSDVVVDDIILIKRGDRVVVDGSILDAHKLEIDESLLTGECHSVHKKIDNKLMSGSFCLSGNGIYKAEKVGDESYAQEITKLAKKFKLNLSPLQVRLNLIIKTLFAIAIILIFLEIFFTRYGLGSVEFVRKLVTIMVSLTPQGLVLMSSVTFALGIYRISKIGAIIQKLNAIESFSNVAIVCTDKTGTLTKNKLTVHKITPLTNKYTTDEIKKLLGTYVKFSIDKNATLKTLEIFNAADALVVEEFPFTSENKMSLLKLIIKDERYIEDNKTITLALGAFDVLVDKVFDKEKEKINEVYKKESLGIYRNLLFGIDKSGVRLESFSSDDSSQIEIEPICIISITDEVRDDVMGAINLFHKNNIEIKILSGDFASTIQAVARDIGWFIKDEDMISGDEIEEMQSKDLLRTIKEKKIFYRLKPQHKLRIVKTLRENKIYTAMIGDGVNDLPAIKEADIGVAMEDGSSITKEIADIILLKNKFVLLPKIFEEGNKIVNTVSSIAKLFLTKIFLVIILTIMSLFAFYEFPLTPRRVALINIFSIGLPAFIITLKNSNINKLKNFTIDLFSFAIISAFIIAVSSYIGQVVTEHYSDFTMEDVQMVMLSILIILTTSNFLVVTIYEGEINLKSYVFYAFGLIALYFSLALTRINFSLLNWIKIFYEISYIKNRYWHIAVVISLLSVLILMILQLTRKRLLNKFT